MSTYLPLHVGLLTVTYHPTYYYMSVYLPLPFGLPTVTCRITYHYISYYPTYHNMSVYLPLHVGLLTITYPISLPQHVFAQGAVYVDRSCDLCNQDFSSLAALYVNYLTDTQFEY